MNLSQIFYFLGAAGGPVLIALAYRLVPELTTNAVLLAASIKIKVQPDQRNCVSVNISTPKKS